MHAKEHKNFPSLLDGCKIIQEICKHYKGEHTKHMHMRCTCKWVWKYKMTTQEMETIVKSYYMFVKLIKAKFQHIYGSIIWTYKWKNKRHPKEKYTYKIQMWE
jgi:hypothetical protein